MLIMPDISRSLQKLLDGRGIDDALVAYLAALHLELREGQLNLDEFADIVWPSTFSIEI
jgi:hypothetical protein